MMRRIAFIIFLLLCVITLVHGIYYYPLLPDHVAKHFNISGHADAWFTKNFFITFYFIITGIFIIIFLGIRYGIQKIPASLINLPNKDYWLSDERKQETFKFISHYSLWFGSATLLLLIEVFNQAFRFNKESMNSLPHPFISLGFYIAFTIVWAIGLFRKFRNMK
jgi:uncharacterized membrane protein